MAGAAQDNATGSPMRFLAKVTCRSACGARSSTLTSLGAVCGVVMVACVAVAAPFTSLPRPAHDVAPLHHRVADANTTDSLTGVRLWLPAEAEMRDARTYNGGVGQNYAIGAITVSVLQFDPSIRSLDNLHRTFRGLENRRIDEAQSWKQPERFAVVGMDGGVTEFSVDIVQQGKEVRGLSIVLSRSRLSASELTRQQSIARRIRTSFQPFGTVLPQDRVAQPAPQPAPPAAPVAAPKQEPPSAPPVAPSWSVARRSADGIFERFVGADLTGDVLVESRAGVTFTDQTCAEACATTSTCAAYTRYGDGRCVMRSGKGDVRQAPSAGTVSGVRAGRS